MEQIAIKPLMRYMYQYTANKNVFSCLQKVSLLTAGLRFVLYSLDVHVKSKGSPVLVNDRWAQS